MYDAGFTMSLRHGGIIQKVRALLFPFAVFCCFLVATERRAYAYVDPGSSLFLVQGIGSSLLGILYFFRRKLSFGKRKGAKEPGAVVGANTANTKR